MTIARIQRLTIPAELSWHYDLMFVAMCLVIATTGEGQRVGSAPRLQAALQTYLRGKLTCRDARIGASMPGSCDRRLSPDALL